ncbi:MAG: hypothetical protein WC753_01350 [Candidatus Gracilibacteria bacterium]
MRIVAIFFLLITKISLAAPKSIFEGGNCGVGTDQLRTGNISFTQIPCIIISITNNILALVGYISLGVILIGALMYVFGGINEEYKSKGKEAFMAAILGAMLSWSAWLIINFLIDNI